MINWTKDNHIEWIDISVKLVRQFKRNENKKAKVIQFKKIKK